MRGSEEEEEGGEGRRGRVERRETSEGGGKRERGETCELHLGNLVSSLYTILLLPIYKLPMLLYS